MKLSSTTRLFS